MPLPPIDSKAVFLNIPYDQEFRSLYVAYVVGLCHLGFVPHLSSEIPGGARRLERTLDLIKRCRYSFHDLSRVEINVAPDATPRFNMPLELGMTITWADLHSSRHTWFVCEAERFRLQRSASDLNGTDAYIHNGKPEGVLRELSNALRRDRTPSVPTMIQSFRFVENCIEPILRRNGTRNPYDRTVFMELLWLSSKVAVLIRQNNRIFGES